MGDTAHSAQDATVGDLRRQARLAAERVALWPWWMRQIAAAPKAVDPTDRGECEARRG
jgi:hypothetical protein